MNKLPSFSIIYETENLASLDLANIYPSLDSLAAQELPIRQAREFFIMDSGDVPAEVLKRLCEKYPWIQVRRIDPDVGYYEAKMKGAGMVSGEILLLCDSDCVYEPNWLRNILTFFAEHPERSVVAGETSTPVRNPYELAIAMNYFFPRYTHRREPYESQHYFCNNVAFHRDFLLSHPIPGNVPLFRGNCLLHAYSLCTLNGEKIWKHPGARALHEPPEMHFSLWRHLLLGRDRVLRKRIERAWAREAKKEPRGRNGSLLRSWMEALELPQIASVVNEDPRRLILFPLSIPIALILNFFFQLGRFMTLFSPNFLLDRYNEYEAKRQRKRLGRS